METSHIGALCRYMFTDYSPFIALHRLSTHGQSKQSTKQEYPANSGPLLRKWHWERPLGSLTHTLHGKWALTAIQPRLMDQPRCVNIRCTKCLKLQQCWCTWHTCTSITCKLPWLLCWEWPTTEIVSAQWWSISMNRWEWWGWHTVQGNRRHVVTNYIPA